MSLAAPLLSGLAGLLQACLALEERWLECLGCDSRSTVSRCLSALLALLCAGLVWPVEELFLSRLLCNGWSQCICTVQEAMISHAICVRLYDRQTSTGAAALLERFACALVSAENYGAQQKASCSLFVGMTLDYFPV